MMPLVRSGSHSVRSRFPKTPEYLRKFFPRSVEQVLTPLRVGVPHQPHDVTAGVEIERARLTEQFHIRLVCQLVTFPSVAIMAAGDQVLPGGETPARARDHVVEREL